MSWTRRSAHPLGVRRALTSDHDLLERVAVLAIKEREDSVELVAHLAVLDTRPSLYAAEGCGTLFAAASYPFRNG
jgi:hypothetical protein